MSLEPISLTESKQLQQLEIIIEANQHAFIQVAEALQHIRDNRLYRSDYASFEAYCKGKWGFSKTYANNLIQGSNAVKSLPKDLTTIVVNESTARALAAVPAPQRAEVIQKAAESGKVTAASIKAAAAPVMPVAPQPSPALAGIDTSKLIELTPKASDLLELALRVRDDMDGLVDCIKGHNCDIQTLADVLKTLGDTRAALVAYQLEIKRG